MLVGLKLRQTRLELSACAESISYVCHICSTPQCPMRTRCAFCGDRRHTYSTRFRPMRRALSDTSVEVLGIANNRSFMRISDAAIKRVVKANPQQAREVLMHLAMQFAPGTPAHKRRAACAQQIHTRANRLLTKIPRGRT